MRGKSSSFCSSFLHERWGLTTEIPIFISFYHLFCGFKNAQKQLYACVLQKRCSSKCFKIYRKPPVPESIFNNVRLATLIKKASTQVFSSEFFEVTKDIFFIKYLRATASECWRLEKSPWLLVEEIIVQPFEFFHFDW